MLFSTCFVSASLASLTAASILQHGNSQKGSLAQSPIHQFENTTHDSVSTQGGYILRDSFTPSNFFNEFEFFTGPDPTHGHVQYKDRDYAFAHNLVNTKLNMIRMGVDAKTPFAPAGRASVRLESKKSYNHGLFVADIQHMPGSACGIWPAYWMFGPDWPYSGEIDIIEGVHNQGTNAITMHTRGGCYANWQNSQPGTSPQNLDCNFNTAFSGCSTSTTAPFGDRFNAGGGGVYATQWESSGIYIWFWPRNAIPADIKALQPDTTKWGTPLAAFNGGSNCNIDSYFKNQKIIFNTAFCGDWAGNEHAWKYSGCASKAPNCQEYVTNNAGVFHTGYWKLNSLRVYQF